MISINYLPSSSSSSSSLVSRFLDEPPEKMVACDLMMFSVDRTNASLLNMFRFSIILKHSHHTSSLFNAFNAELV